MSVRNNLCCTMATVNFDAKLEDQKKLLSNFRCKHCGKRYCAECYKERFWDTDAELYESVPGELLWWKVDECGECHAERS